MNLDEDDDEDHDEEDNDDDDDESTFLTFNKPLLIDPTRLDTHM